MMLLFELRAKITALYQKYDYWINLGLRFVLLLFAFNRIAKMLPYSRGLCKSPTIIAISLVCAFLPSGLTVVIAAIYVALQIVAAESPILAVLVFALFMICYCFFLRFTPREGASMIATPVLMSYGIPYAVPLLLGLFSNLLSIVPMCCGVFAYYTIAFVRENIDTLAKYNLRKEPQEIFISVLDQLLKNPSMYVVMLILAIVVVAVYFVRRINMDYAFEISIAVGTGVMMLGYIIGDLKYDMGIRIAGMVFGSLICAGVTLVLLFFVRVLQYAAAERVEFEDDDYFYYVKAIPKLKAGAPKRKEKKVIRRRKADEDDDDDELMEDTALGLIDFSNKAVEGLAADKGRKTAEPVPEEDEDDEFGDDIGELTIKPRRYETRVGDGADGAAPAAKPAKATAATAAPTASAKAAAVRMDEDDDDDFDDIAPAPKKAPAPAKKSASGKKAATGKKSAAGTKKAASGKSTSASAAPASKTASAASAAPAAAPKAEKKPAPVVPAKPATAFLDDDDDDEDEQVIYDYFPDGAKNGDAGAPTEDEDYL